jgi:hypothetical protein
MIMYGVIDFSLIDTMPGGFGPFAPPAGWQGDYRQYLQARFDGDIGARQQIAVVGRIIVRKLEGHADRVHRTSCRRGTGIRTFRVVVDQSQLTQHQHPAFGRFFHPTGSVSIPDWGRCLPVFYWRHHVRQIRTSSRTGHHRAWHRERGLPQVPPLQHWQPDSGGRPATSKGFAPVADREFNRWKELGRSVCKGQKAISLWMPLTVKRRDKDDFSGASGDTGEVFTVFKLAPRWFSLEQTEGEDYIEPVESPQWDAEAALAHWISRWSTSISWTAMCRAMR